MKKPRRRSRYIRPEFFMDEEIAECSLRARLFFIGLWCFADREGRVEFREKRLKAEIFPYEDVRIDEIVGELDNAGKLKCYHAGGKSMILVKNFAKHQNIHHGEPKSDLPAPPQRTSKRKPADAPALESRASTTKGLREGSKVPLTSDSKKLASVVAPGNRRTVSPASSTAVSSSSGGAAAGGKPGQTSANLGKPRQGRTSSRHNPYPNLNLNHNHNQNPNRNGGSGPKPANLLGLKLRFGKEHKGKLISDVPPSYAKWMLNSKRYQGELDGTTRLALQERVNVKAEEVRR